MPHDSWILIDGLNPEPWTAPQFSTGKRGGKVIALPYKNPGLDAYQHAIKEDLAYNYPNFEPFDSDISLEIFLWRQLPAYAADSGQVRKHVADATNMQKALEDALQGHLLVNDREVQHIETTIVAQEYETEPRILIHIMKFGGVLDSINKKADAIAIERASKSHPANPPKALPGVEDIF